jgi:Galactose oxidase, central domain
MNPLVQPKKRFPPFGIVTPRALVSLIFCTVAGFLVTGTVLAFFQPEAPTKIPQTTPTFAERGAYQRAIEDVYWRHRIWPKENPYPKPSLDAVMSQAQLEKKVTDYLRYSHDLEDYWQRPITTEQLQAEMDRMAKHTKQPEVLRELFEALENDPAIIAECLARPILAERLIADLSSKGQTRQVESPQTDGLGAMSAATTLGQVVYTLPKIADAGDHTPDEWTATTTSNAPHGRSLHNAVWTGSEMVVWGGGIPGTPFNTGGRYIPSTDSWTATSTTNAPIPRDDQTAVWTGTEMIVWGGRGPVTPPWLNTGGRYNPATDSWAATSTTNAPLARANHTAVWTGSEMIIWGGNDSSGPFNTGGRYDPDTDTWTSTSTTNAPSGRYYHTAVWAGGEMIVWGGYNGSNPVNTGGRYNPGTDTWRATGITNVPDGRSYHTAVWTGREMIVWGGNINSGSFNTGGRYNPGTDSWTATSTINAPSPRTVHTAIWTGSEMIVWGGFIWTGSYFNTGGRYNPSIDSWTATSTSNAPSARAWHTAIWTGSEMIVWGGQDQNVIPFNTGGRYGANVSPQLGNISTRAFVQTGDNVMIGGFIVQGTEPKRVIIRAIGPELTRYGVPEVLANPTLELHNAAGALIASNDNWQHTVIGGIITSDQRLDIRQSGHAPGNPLESAIIADLPDGNYTAIVRGVNNTTGVGLVEVYDLSPDSNSVLSNISTRSFVQTGDNVMIGGLIVQGTQSKRVIIRAIGPELTQYGVPNVLANPTLELHDSTGALIASNDNWLHTIIGGVITSDQTQAIRNSGHAPGDNRESAIKAELPAGNYTAIVRGVNNMMGVALVEVYALDQ